MRLVGEHGSSTVGVGPAAPEPVPQKKSEVKREKQKRDRVSEQEKRRDRVQQAGNLK